MNRNFVLALPAAMVLAACQPAPENRTGAAVSPEQGTTSAMPDSGLANNPLATPPEIAPSSPATAEPGPGEDGCGASKVRKYIGEEATVPVRSAVARESGARTDRWIYPDSMITEDFSATRLNVVMDKATNRIASMNCG